MPRRRTAAQRPRRQRTTTPPADDPVTCSRSTDPIPSATQPPNDSHPPTRAPAPELSTAPEEFWRLIEAICRDVVPDQDTNPPHAVTARGVGAPRSPSWPLAESFRQTIESLWPYLLAAIIGWSLGNLLDLPPPFADGIEEAPEPLQKHWEPPVSSGPSIDVGPTGPPRRSLFLWQFVPRDIRRCSVYNATCCRASRLTRLPSSMPAMSDSLPNPTASRPALGDDLPPVQPPSAGFIFQLFVVPALIVLAVVAVWALFGRLAAGEQDWRALVQDLHSANPHVYKRAMFGLAQLLDTDRRLGSDGQHLAANPQIATALSELLHKQLAQTAQDEETLKVQVYLSRALGLLDVPETTVPVLIEALDAQRDVEIRKGAVTSVAMLAGRRFEEGRPLSGAIEAALVTLSQDPDPSLRRAAAFALGLVPGEASQQRLIVLLEDPADWMTSVNAAIALSRQKSTAGYAVLVKSLKPAENNETPEAAQERVLIQKNTLKAIADLSSQFDAAQRAELKQLVTPLADDAAEARVRIDARGALAALDAAG